MRCLILCRSGSHFTVRFVRLHQICPWFPVKDLRRKRGPVPETLRNHACVSSCNVSYVYLKMDESHGWRTRLHRSHAGHNIYKTQTWITHTNTKSVFIYWVITLDALRVSVQMCPGRWVLFFHMYQHLGCTCARSKVTWCNWETPTLHVWGALF